MVRGSTASQSPPMELLRLIHCLKGRSFGRQSDKAGDMNRRIVSSAVALVVAWAMPTDVSAQAPAVIMTYSLSSPSVTVGEPALLNFELSNNTNSEVAIDLGRDRKQNFSFDVTFPDGTKVRELSLPRKEGFGAG